MPVIKLTRAEILRITTLNDTVWTQREKKVTNRSDTSGYFKDAAGRWQWKISSTAADWKQC